MKNHPEQEPDVVNPTTDRLPANIDWPTFLARHDLLYTALPTEWFEAPFLGNGTLGCMIRKTGPQRLQLDIGHGRVQDHRQGEGIHGRCRLPIGQFVLTTSGELIGGSLRLNLWNAEVTGEIQTTNGSVQIRVLVISEAMLLVAEVNPDAGEEHCSLTWEALPAICPRYTYRKESEGYDFNPPSALQSAPPLHLSVQSLLAGGEVATAWTVQTDGSARRLLASVAQSFADESAREVATAAVNSGIEQDMGVLVEAHRAWWHAYYPQSFVSLPDPMWESHYWIQIYKLASATRADGMLIDNQGPWLQPTPWPGAWWNLNVQLSYWPVYGANRLALGQSLNRALFDNLDALIANVPEPFQHDAAGIGRSTGQLCVSPVTMPGGEGKAEIGNLLWACHNVWLFYRHSLDRRTLEDLFPLLRRAVNLHLHIVEKDSEGIYHLPTTYSPEYNSASGPDCNYDLALLLWGCQALLEISTDLGIEDPLRTKWVDVAEHLVEFPVDENGYRIARTVPFAMRHRHFSHLLMLYPLYLRTHEEPGIQELAMTSVKHWHSMGKMTGYSQTGASSICSAFGEGDLALKYLNGLKEFFEANTLYKEAGPVIETPLSAAQSIHDMLLQSWGDTLRVFPAVPSAWGDVAFADLRAQGAFLVSAVRQDGVTQWVQITSLAGAPCRVIPNLPGRVQVQCVRTLTVQKDPSRALSLDLQKGETVLLYSGDAPTPRMHPIATDPQGWNFFGMRAPAP